MTTVGLAEGFQVKDSFRRGKRQYMFTFRNKMSNMCGMEQCNTDVCFLILLLLSFSVYIVLICSSISYDPLMDYGAVFLHVICAWYVRYMKLEVVSRCTINLLFL